MNYVTFEAMLEDLGGTTGAYHYETEEEESRSLELIET